MGALTWGYADFRAGHHYINPSYFYVNILVCYLSLLILGMLVKGLRDNLLRQAAARKEVEKTLEELKQSTAEVQKLQGQLQVICAWSKKLRVDDKWMTIEEFLKDHLHINVSHGISPEMFKKFSKEIKALKPQPES